MMITRSAHEKALGILSKRLDVAGIPENAGIHGPQSIAWQVNAELTNFLGAGCAVLMQLAHPYVAHGIAEHSTALADIRQRFVGTFESVFQMTFGTRSEAFQSARTIHRVHTHIHGTLPSAIGHFESGHRYHANEASALRWVFATLVSTAMAVHTDTGLRLTPHAKEEFYQASKNFALLFGLTEEMLPATRSDFEVFVREHVRGNAIVVSEPAREIASYLMAAPMRSLEPAFLVYRALTAKFLVPSLRRAYGLSYGRKEAALAALALRVWGPLRTISPAGMRQMPDAIRAETRLGLRRPNRLSTLVESALLSGLKAWPSNDGKR
tara:strand:- start:175790 stop:176761 length:972 start_codon:yes stop_codon:yes gene_type:complete